MPSTYSPLKIQLMATGENNTTWGNVTNTNLGIAIEEALVGSEDVTFASANVTLTLTDTNASQTARNLRLRCTGTTGGSTRNLVVPSTEKPYIVQNDCADSIVIKTSAGSGITVPAGKTMWVYNNGTDVVDATSHLSSLTLGTALPVLSGGTGSNTAGGARTNLGASVVGSNFFTLANPSAITFPRVNADNTVSTLAAAAFRTAIGSTTLGDNLYTITNPSAVTFPRFNVDNTVSALTASELRTAIGASTGTVTSVSGTGTVNGLSLTGTVTSDGSLTLGGTLSGVSLTTAVTGTLPIANGGTNATDAAGARSSLGAAASGTNTDITVMNPASGLQVGSPTGGAKGVGTINATGLFVNGVSVGTSTGTVSSVSGAGSVNGITLTGTVTDVGSLTLGGSLSGVNLTSQVTGTLPVANGGTGQTSYTNGQLLIGNSTGNTLTKATLTAGSGIEITNGAGAITITSTATSGTVTSVGMSVPAFLSVANSPITSSGTLAVTLSGAALPVANGGTGATTLTGILKGNGVSAFTAATAGTDFVAPGGALGTPSSGTLTNCTFPTLNQNTTGSAGSVANAVTFTNTGGALPGTTFNGSAARIIDYGTVGAPKADGTGASGTWGISISGSAASASSASTAGSVTNAVTFAASGGAAAGTTFNGSAARTVDFSTVGAYAATNPSGFTSNTGTVTSIATSGSTNGLSLTGGTITSTGTITLSGSVTSVAATATIDGVVIGYRSIPRSTTSSTATTSDVGKCIAVTAGITIPNSTFAAGDAVSIYNDSGSAITITAGVSTLRQAGTTNTGNRTLAARGMATIWFNSATEAIISGAGVS